MLDRGYSTAPDSCFPADFADLPLLVICHAIGLSLFSRWKTRLPLLTLRDIVAVQK